MVESGLIRYTPKVQAPEFIDGKIFDGPKEDIDWGKFVRISKLFVVSLRADNVYHQGLISQYGLGAGQRQRFLRTFQTLANAGSRKIDAGFIEVSLQFRKVRLSGESLGLCRNFSVPVVREGREISREVIQALCPGYTIKIYQPDRFK